MVGKLVLIMIALFAIGVLVLPSTVSLFAGQHLWYDINAEGNDIPCVKCHADIAEELKNDPFHRGFSSTGDINRDCEVCHRGVNITYAIGDTNQPGKEAHAASTLSCLICHSDNWDVHGTGEGHSHDTYPSDVCAVKCHVSHGMYPGIASGFGIIPSRPGWFEDYGSYAAHRKFVLEAKNNSLMTDYNEACIACHTHVAVKITWKHASALEFTSEIASGNQATGGSHNWTISQWSVNTTKKFVATSWGNTTGNGSTSYWSGWPGNVDNIYE